VPKDPVHEAFLRGARCREPAAYVIPGTASQQQAHRCIQRHVPRTDVEGQHLRGLAAGREDRDIRDAPDVENRSAHARLADEGVIEQWHQWRALSSRGHVPGAEVAGHLHTEALGDHSTLADLQRRPAGRVLQPARPPIGRSSRSTLPFAVGRMPSVGRSSQSTLRQMRHCMPMAAHRQHVNGRQPCAVHRLVCRIRQQLADTEVQPREFGHRHAPLGTAQQLVAGVLVVRDRGEVQ